MALYSTFRHNFRLHIKPWVWLPLSIIYQDGELGIQPSSTVQIQYTRQNLLKTLQQTYKRPFKILKRHSKYFTVRVNTVGQNNFGQSETSLFFKCSVLWCEYTNEFSIRCSVGCIKTNYKAIWSSCHITQTSIALIFFDFSYMYQNSFSYRYLTWT